MDFSNAEDIELCVCVCWKPPEARQKLFEMSSEMAKGVFIKSPHNITSICDDL